MTLARFLEDAANCFRRVPSRKVAASVKWKEPRLRREVLPTPVAPDFHRRGDALRDAGEGERSSKRARSRSRPSDRRLGPSACLTGRIGPRSRPNRHRDSSVGSRCAGGRVHSEEHARRPLFMGDMPDELAPPLALVPMKFCTSYAFTLRASRPTTPSYRLAPMMQPSCWEERPTRMESHA
jgi:hypothetical protein